MDSKGKGISNVGVYGYRENGTTYVDRYDRTDKDGYVNLYSHPGELLNSALLTRRMTTGRVWSMSPQMAKRSSRPGRMISQYTWWAPSGKGIANITVLAYNPGGKYLGILGTTNSEGIAYLSVSNGSYLFKATVNGAEYWSDKINVTQQKSATIQVASQSESQSYTIHLINKKNKPLEGADVYVRDSDDKYTGISGTTNSDGQITVELAPGTYIFRVDYQKESWISSDYDFPGSDPLTIKVPVK